MGEGWVSGRKDSPSPWAISLLKSVYGLPRERRSRDKGLKALYTLDR